MVKSTGTGTKKKCLSEITKMIFFKYKVRIRVWINEV